MNTLDLRTVGACGLQLVEYKPGLREEVLFASTSAWETRERAQEILRKRATSIQPSSNLRFFLKAE